MAAQTQISVEEYLRTSFDGPDREYVDGEIVERNVGDYRHSKAQRRLVTLFDRLADNLPLHPLPELRVKLAPKRYRVIDLAVFSGDEPTEDVPSSPPLIAIEILSPDDRFADVLEKFEDYRKWGVPHCWFVDPRSRKIYVYSAGLSEVPAFRIPEFDVEIPATEIFR